MHDLGYILHYGEDKALKDEMILQPEWVTKAIGYVLEDRETNRLSGELAHGRLRDIWYEHQDKVPLPDGEKWERYDPALHSFFLRLMEKYDVSYRLEDGKSSLVAQLVPDVRPPLPWMADDQPP